MKKGSLSSAERDEGIESEEGAIWRWSGCGGGGGGGGFNGFTYISMFGDILKPCRYWLPLLDIEIVFPQNLLT